MGLLDLFRDSDNETYKAVGDGIDMLIALFDLVVTAFDWAFFFFSSPMLVIMALIAFAFIFALSQAKNVPQFIALVIGIVFPALKAFLDVVVLLLRAIGTIIQALKFW